MSAKEQPPTETDDNEEGEVALVEKAYLTVVTIIICFTVVTIIYPDCKVINSLGAMANAALRTRTWLVSKGGRASLQPAVADFSTADVRRIYYCLPSCKVSVSLQLRRHL